MIVQPDKIQEGHFNDKMFVGLTRFEHGIGQKAVYLKENQWQIYARTGAGKFITHGAHLAIQHPSSAVIISPKSSEWVDFSLGRRTDLSLWDRHPNRSHRLGIDPRKITKTRFHIKNGRCFVCAPSNQSVYREQSTPHTLLSDVFSGGFEFAWSRLVAICGASFPGDPNSSRDPWFWKCPTGALSCASGHVMTRDKDTTHHNLPYALRWLMGVDPKTGVASPKARAKHFNEMLKNKCFNGRLQIGAAALLSLGERAFGTLNSELETNAGGWILDERYQKTLTGKSAFSYEEVGKPDWPVTVYVSPVQGEVEGEAFLRAHYRLASLIFQQRDWKPDKAIALVGDEIGSWGASLSEECLRILAIGRSKNIMCVNYWQDYNQMVSAWGEAGAQSAVSNSAIDVFGINDQGTRDFVKSRLSKTTVRQRVGGRRAPAVAREVDLVSDDAIDRELKMTSPIKYVFSPARSPMALTRPAFKDIRTPEGAFFEGLPGLEGHYDEF